MGGGNSPVLAVLGLGYVGLPLALGFARRFRVVAFDIDPERVARLRAGVDASGALEEDGAAGCDILTIGQYLQPSPGHYPLDRYATPEDFARYKKMALDKGFRYVASAPLARSSYKAWEALEGVHDLH